LNSVSTKHIVFLDGFVSSVNHMTPYELKCTTWLQKDYKLRRLVVICSLSSGYTSRDEDKMVNVKTFFVPSWKIEEYMEAVKDPDYLATISKYLDSPCFPNASLEDKVRAKFFYSGGSCRLFSAYLTEEVKETIEQSVAKARDMLSLGSGTKGMFEDNVTNRLFGSFDGKSSFVVSRYTAELLSIRLGPMVIRNLAQIIQLDTTRSVDGGLLEVWFFASLRHGGLDIMENGTSRHWEQSEVMLIDTSNPPTFPDDKAVWCKPINRQQGGYDAVYVDKAKQFVRFVQVTTAQEHSLKLEYFQNFFKILMERPVKHETKTLEIWIVSDQEYVKITPVEGRGLLHIFGFKKGYEEDSLKRGRVKGIYK